MIIAAGDGTRMGKTPIPKALHLINNKSNLVRTYEFVEQIFDEIFVVIKNEHVELFAEECVNNKLENIYLIPIESGKGDGHAVMTALRTLDTNTLNDDFIIMWGDCVLNGNQIILELLKVNFDDPRFIFPVKNESNPYVWFKLDDKNLPICAKFSKKEEFSDVGLHDQSLFKHRGLELLYALNKMHSILYRDGKYITGEMNFLHLIHYFYNINQPAFLYQTKYYTESFNSIMELQEISKIKHPET